MAGAYGLRSSAHHGSRVNTGESAGPLLAVAARISCTKAGRIDASALTWTRTSTSSTRLAMARPPLARDASGAIFVAMARQRGEEAKFTGVAWGHVAGCKRVTDATFDVLRAFTQRYRDKGPEFVA